MAVRVLLFGYGNPSRGDDALGPALIERIDALRAAHRDWPELELLTDFQPQVEHALDMQGRDRVVVADASITADAPFSFQRMLPAEDTTYTTHALAPQGLLHIYQRVTGTAPPPAFLLGIRGERFELGESMSVAALQNLDHAVAFTIRLLDTSDPLFWEKPTNA
jgi:hydrogenase maturation protease